MDPHALAHRTAADPYQDHLVDTIVTCGQYSPYVLAAEERHREAVQCTAVWAAVHADRERKPGAARRWLGTLLVRAGGRLQGASTTTIAAGPATIVGPTGAAG